jgi:membrane protease subunit HflK
MHQVADEPLDPANQSLADALRASFGVLKFIMLIIVVIYLCSGITCVDQKEVVVLTRFGKQIGKPREPGLLTALPYPFHEQIHVPTAPKTLLIDDFWLRLRDVEKTKDLGDLSPRTGGLDPATDGALLTGDRAIMHLLCNVQYRITNANDFVKNVQEDETELIKTVIQNAAVAESARTFADIIWKDAGTLAEKIKHRAQKLLNRLESGILIENVAADKSYYPLQAKNEFEDVDDAANKQRELIQEAEAKWAEILNGVAGTAWEKLYEQIQRLDQVEDGPAKDAVIKNIESILVNEASGEAGGLIKLAEKDRNKIIAQTKTEVATFETLLEQYRKNPELVREQLRQNMLEELYAQQGVTKWLLPPGNKQLIITINNDPIQIRQAARKKRLERLGVGQK